MSYYEDLVNCDNVSECSFNGMPNIINTSVVTGRVRGKQTSFYASRNGNIVDAETGIYKNIKVGSLKQDTLFKVKCVQHKRYLKNNNTTFFYSSPDEFSKHMGMKNVNTSSINKWKDRQ